MILETLKNYKLAIKQESKYKIKFLEISKPAVPGIWRLKKAVVYSSHFKKFKVKDKINGTPCPIEVASEIIMLHYLKWDKLPLNTFLDIAVEIKKLAAEMNIEPALAHIDQ
ncbi:MAG: hypothetical protein KY428_06440 [Bacteroidetes bacterium]|nr:hypothetical protein [Bacteroidota bacterium]